MEKIIFIGAGALATDIYENVSRTRNFIGALVDPEYAAEPEFLGMPVLTDWRQAAEIATHYVLALADIDQRTRMRSLAMQFLLQPCVPLISDRANISSSATIADGCVIGPFCWVGARARIGSDCLLMNHIIAGHDCVVDENAVFCPGSNFAGNTKIGANCFVGSNAVISPGVSLGARSFAAAGAACLRDSPEASFLIGNPARRSSR